MLKQRDSTVGGGIYRQATGNSDADVESLRRVRSPGDKNRVTSAGVHRSRRRRLGQGPPRAEQSFDGRNRRRVGGFDDAPSYVVQSARDVRVRGYGRLGHGGSEFAGERTRVATRPRADVGGGRRSNADDGVGESDEVDERQRRLGAEEGGVTQDPRGRPSPRGVERGADLAAEPVRSVEAEEEVLHGDGDTFVGDVRSARVVVPGAQADEADGSRSRQNRRRSRDRRARRPSVVDVGGGDEAPRVE